MLYCTDFDFSSDDVSSRTAGDADLSQEDRQKIDGSQSEESKESELDVVAVGDDSVEKANKSVIENGAFIQFIMHLIF